MEFDSEGNVILGTVIGLPIFNIKQEEWDLRYTKLGDLDTFVKGIHKTGDDAFLLATTSGFYDFNLKTGREGQERSRDLETYPIKESEEGVSIGL